MRLDKYLSKAIAVTRSQAREYIRGGKITVNEHVVYKKDFHIDENKDKIYFENKFIEYQEFIYLMLNKPQGVVSACTDQKYRTVVDLVEYKDLFPVGRLDIDTEGLLILTNNGTFAHRLTSPKYGITKKYFFEVEKPLSNEYIKYFQEGLTILDGKNKLFTTKPASLEFLSENTGIIEITEGKFHQIKRMFAKVNNRVKYLKRIALAELKLDENLDLGKYRQLTNEEINYLKSLCRL